jgi:transketolase C-terminal domain/subunit
MEGSIGPVAGSSHHSLYYRMPGVKIYSPMSSDEYKECYNDFMNSDDVFYVSEHRESYNNNKELKDIVFPEPDCILFPISVTRFAAMEASKILLEKGIKVSVYHQKILKPYLLDNQILKHLNSCGLGIVLDDDYEDGIASNIAHKLMMNSNSKVYTMGLKNRSAGFAKHLDNLPPSSQEICNFIKNIIEKKNG